MKNEMIKAIILLSIVISVIIVIGYKKNSTWNKAEKKYALAFVKGLVGGGAGPSQDRYTYVLANITYVGKKYSLKQKRYYIVTVLDSDFSAKSIEIKYPVDRNILVPQPPEGWDECPINEDGTIKAKYRRRDKNGNIIKSKPTDKSSIEKKKNKNEEKIDEQALDLIFENRK